MFNWQQLIQSNHQNGNLFYFLMTCAATLIILLPVGIANAIFGYLLGDSPCTLCWGQRIAMMYIGVAALFIVRYGFKGKYIACILIFSAFGLWESFRHFANYAGKDLDQSFGLAIFGIHTPFWAEIVFWCVIFLLGVMFFFAPKEGFKTPGPNEKSWIPFTTFSKVCVGICITVLASNLFQAIWSTGLPPNYGQGDPVRFSFNPANLYHTSAGMKGNWSKIDFLGERNVKAPDFAFAPNAENLGITFVHDSAQAPIAVNQELQIKDSKHIDINQPLNSLNFVDGEYIVSSKFDVYYLNQNLQVIDKFRIDPLFSANIDPIVGVVSKDGKYVLMGSNKTLLNFEKSPTTEPKSQLIGRYSDFEEGEDRFLAGNRMRVGTNRSKLHHIASLSADDKYMYAATVPNNNNKKDFYIIKFLLKDRQVSGEFTPTASLKDGRSLGELYVTGIAKDGDKLYILSKNYNIILEIDVPTEEVTKVYGYPSSLTDARGLLKTTTGFQILDHNNLIDLD